MSRIKVCVAAALAVVGVGFVSLAGGAPAEQEYQEIGPIMKDLFKGKTSVVNRAGAGEASPEEIAKLHAAIKTLTTLDAPQGDGASWKEKTAALLAACEKLTVDPKDAAAFKQAANCKACHDIHKP